LRAPIFQQLFECIARGLHTPLSVQKLPLHTPIVQQLGVRRDFPEALRRLLPSAADGACTRSSLLPFAAAGVYALLGLAAAAVAPSSSSVQLLLCSDAPCGMVQSLARLTHI
jgi:hypothetical protein